MRYILAADSILGPYMLRSENVTTVLSDNQNVNPLDADPETDFNAKWPFKGHLYVLRCLRRATMGYIVQYNNCGLKCKGSDDMASERSENRRFRRPTLI